MISPQITIGPFTFHLYGFIIAIAIYLGWYLAKKRAHRLKIPQKIFEDPIILVSLFLGIIGARLYHVLHYWPYYISNPAQIIAITNGGLGIWGALIGVFAGFWIFAKVKKLDFLSFLDLTAPSILLGQAIGRIGNYINQEGFGPPTNMPWGVYIEPENRPIQFITSTHFHPTFFYEAILDLVFFMIIVKFSQKLNVKGQLFGLYLVLYGVARFIAEIWRIDTWTVGTIKIAYILSLAAIVIGVRLFFGSSKPLTINH